MTPVLHYSLAGVHLGSILEHSPEVTRTARLGEVLHVGRLDVHDGEALVRDVQVPQVHPEVVRADERLLRNPSDKCSSGQQMQLHRQHISNNTQKRK